MTGISTVLVFLSRNLFVAWKLPDLHRHTQRRSGSLLAASRPRSIGSLAYQVKRKLIHLLGSVRRATSSWLPTDNYLLNHALVRLIHFRLSFPQLSPHNSYTLSFPFRAIRMLSGMVMHTCVIHIYHNIFLCCKIIKHGNLYYSDLPIVLKFLSLYWYFVVLPV